MPKCPTFPTLFDDALQVNLSKLKEWKYLESGSLKLGTLTWSRNGNKTGSISILVDMTANCPFLELDYRYRDEPRNYKVYLVNIPSNLGKGNVWYFRCPQTSRLCRKLYSVGGYFLHRSAFTGCMYESQTRSKKYRQLDRVLGVYFKSDQLYEQLHKKHFKKWYAGQPTKKYKRLSDKLKRIEGIPYSEIEKMYCI